MSLAKIISSVEAELAQKANGSAIILEEYKSFKSTLEASLGVKLSAKVAREAYAAAVATAEKMEANFKAKDPLGYSLLKGRVKEEYYLVSSGPYSARTVKKSIDSVLATSGVVEGKSVIPAPQTAQIDASRVKQVKYAASAYSEILTARGSFSAKASVTVALFNSLPDVATKAIFLKYVKENAAGLVKDLKGRSTLHTKLTNHLMNTLDPKRTPKNQSSKTLETTRPSSGRIKITKSPRPFFLTNRGGKTSPLKLINAINRQLPSKIRTNMGTPRLNWRTGRFGNSIKAIKIDQATDNTGVITYSYMGYPYSIFEPGSGSPLANTNRDPRRLIDMTIRDIAKSLTNAKFTTRRSFS